MILSWLSIVALWHCCDAMVVGVLSPSTCSEQNKNNNENKSLSFQTPGEIAFEPQKILLKKPNLSRQFGRVGKPSMSFFSQAGWCSFSFHPQNAHIKNLGSRHVVHGGTWEGPFQLQPFTHVSHGNLRVSAPNKMRPETLDLTISRHIQQQRNPFPTKKGQLGGVPKKKRGRIHTVNMSIHLAIFQMSKWSRCGFSSSNHRKRGSGISGGPNDGICDGCSNICTHHDWNCLQRRFVLFL